MTRDEMRAWEPDPKATIFELRYHYCGMSGTRKVLKCPISARVAVHAFADDFKVQCLTVIPIGPDGRPMESAA